MDYGATSPVERHSPWFFIPMTAKSTPQCPNCRPSSCHFSLRQTCWFQLSTGTLAAKVYPPPPRVLTQRTPAHIVSSSHTLQIIQSFRFKSAWHRLLSQLLRNAAWNEILWDIMNASRGCRCDLFKDCPSNFLQVLGGHKISHDSWIHITARIGLLALVYVRSHVFSWRGFIGTRMPEKPGYYFSLNLAFCIFTYYQHPDVMRQLVTVR